MKKIALLILILLALPASLARAEVDLICINVGKGDALLLRTEDCCCLIDAGKKSAQAQIEAVFEQLGIDALDAVFITHTDKDHAGGLKWLRHSDISVGAIYASKYHPESSLKKHPAVQAADALGLEVQWLGAGDRIPLGEGGAALNVLAPEIEIPENEDDNSLVMMLDSPDGRILFAGDMELYEESLLLQSGADLRCDVLKVPNHGDGDACSESLIRACAPKLAVISTDSREKEDTPDERVLRNLREQGCAVRITQDYSPGVRVRLSGGRVYASE